MRLGCYGHKRMRRKDTQSEDIAKMASEVVEVPQAAIANENEVFYPDLRYFYGDV